MKLPRVASLKLGCLFVLWLLSCGHLRFSLVYMYTYMVPCSSMRSVFACPCCDYRLRGCSLEPAVLVHSLFNMGGGSETGSYCQYSEGRWMFTKSVLILMYTHVRMCTCTFTCVCTSCTCTCVHKTTGSLQPLGLSRHAQCNFPLSAYVCGLYLSLSLWGGSVSVLRKWPNQIASYMYNTLVHSFTVVYV